MSAVCCATVSCCSSVCTFAVRALTTAGGAVFGRPEGRFSSSPSIACSPFFSQR